MTHSRSFASASESLWFLPFASHLLLMILNKTSSRAPVMILAAPPIGLVTAAARREPRLGPFPAPHVVTHRVLQRFIQRRINSRLVSISGVQLSSLNRMRLPSVDNVNLSRLRDLLLPLRNERLPVVVVDLLDRRAKGRSLAHALMRPQSWVLLLFVYLQNLLLLYV